MTTLTTRPLASWLLALSAVLTLGGMALLFGVSPITLPTPGTAEVSVAYSSELVIALDDAPSFSNLLAWSGRVLLVGGLMVSAAAVGLRWGRQATADE